MLLRPGVSKGDITGPNCRGLVFQEGTEISNEATNGLAPSVLDTFSGAARAVSYVFPPASEKDPRRETPGLDSHFAPEAWCSREGTYTTDPKNRGLVFLGGDIARPTIVQRGYRRVGTVGVCHFSGAVGADSWVSPPTSEEDPSEKPRAWIRVVLPRPGVPGRGRCRPEFQHGF